MEAKNKVLEALQMQPLSEEEKNRRHILGRLWGPIATTKEKTRNGRGYNAELWRKALADEIFKEKVACKSLFLELGHPVDREETDINAVCACIPELPQLIDGDLYAYVDILDTKQGRLLKTLCDYGFIPGISSRGSGDVMDNDDVDPETFFLETWDIVQLPAVKRARLKMCESLKTTKNLKTVLNESLNQMSDEDQKETKEILERLGVDLISEDAEVAFQDDPYPDIPWVPGEEPLIEDTEEVEAVPEETDQPEESAAEELSIEEDLEDKEDIEDTDEEDELEDSEDSEDSEDEEDIQEAFSFTVSDMVENLQDFEKDAILEFAPIEIEGIKIQITDLTLDDSEEGKVVISFGYDSPEVNDNIEDAKEDSEVEPQEDDLAEQDTSDEATDSGDEEVLESLVEIVRQKNALEETVADLKNQVAVGDAVAKDLKEELNKYKTGFRRVSELAAKANKLQAENNTLTESLANKESLIGDLTAKVGKQTQLNESVARTAGQVKDLQQRLRTVVDEASSTEQALKEQVETTRKAVQKNLKLAQSYKQRFEAVVEHYIASKAMMLGVTSQDIKSKLQENYTVSDIDRVCDTLLEAGRPVFGFSRGAQKASTVKINEALTGNASEEDDLSDLLELAGLK